MRAAVWRVVSEWLIDSQVDSQVCFGIVPLRPENGEPPCSEGFATAPALARKAVRLFACAAQLLSRQAHYDFGMRALKTLLTAAGSARSTFRASATCSGADDVEAAAFIRALHSCVMPKLVAHDVELLSDLISVRLQRRV